MSKYYDWDDFKNIYLEDSFVLGIDESEEQVSFTVEMVLTEDHPMYSPPRKDEQYCYKKGKIVFQDLQSVRWLHRNMQPFIDADENKDYGNIDCFELSSAGYHLLGDWGEVIIKSSEPKVVWRA